VLLGISSGEAEGAADAIELGLDWLDAAQPGERNEWLATSMLVEVELGDPEVGLDQMDRLLSRQNADGGWSWFAEEPSDAFSTGLTLYALMRVGYSSEHASISGAVAYLLAQQREDGIWAVASDLTSNASSPGKDYVYE